MGWDGFFVDERTVGLHGVADADSVGGCEASVDFDEKFDIFADGFTDGGEFLDGYAFGLDGDEEAAVVEGVAF